MVPWRIEGCTVDDAVALGRYNGAAFWEQPMWKMMWPKDKTREYMIEQLTKRIPMRLLRDRDAMRHQKAVDAETGALIGYARWELPEGSKVAPGTGGPEWADAQVPDVGADQWKAFEELEGSSWWEPREDMGELDSKNEAIQDRILATRPYIKLDYLAVHPENMGRGIATALVESGMREAEKMGIPIYVFAFKSARGIYVKLGFKEVDRLIQDDSAFGGNGDYGVYFMVSGVAPGATR
ncbi:hypothetical protein TOPH_05781 [Tolypocladium ophioglossoides CBS 100239]|uniref:N-acetyltransferase domain-containing protein n=1 Tax=Tolypocladium ophioglossoides (strain CBS 100239) TaxID=1163406 RepID=A0A0L0N6Q6_TOLOC|nr:hypothetical protein TOPH_05781 [Tolypocladium ophioglossoides CBS 100239]